MRSFIAHGWDSTPASSPTKQRRVILSERGPGVFFSPIASILECLYFGLGVHDANPFDQ
jgi:hypothetical protein